MKTQSDLKQLFGKMWQHYCQLNPEAQRVYNCIATAGENVENDHIAFRTVSLPEVNKDVLAKFFTQYGYVKKGEYVFKGKKLTAHHFEHTDVNMPKVFISQLELDWCSHYVKTELTKAIQSASFKNLNDESILYSGKHWSAFYAIYLNLYEESEYAAWFYAHGFKPNHFTVYINHLKKLNDIQKLNQFLKDNGFKLNQSGGEIKGSPADYLEQSSTMASEVPVRFGEGIYNVPGCYYEFAKRYTLSDGSLYQGFVEKSADKIFESTNQI